MDSSQSASNEVLIAFAVGAAVFVVMAFCLSVTWLAWRNFQKSKRRRLRRMRNAEAQLVVDE